MVSVPARSPASRRGARLGRAWFVAGFVATTLVVVVDTVRHHDVLLTAVLGGPLIAAMGASSVAVAILGVYAVGAALWLGTIDDIFLSTDHIIRVVVVAVAAIIAYVIALRRERREREFADVLPQADDAQRVRLALGAANMGTWQWDLDTGHIEWDEQLEALFGLAPGTFDGHYDTYIALIHPDDRVGSGAAVQGGMARGTPWRFDHRVVWPDGSVHWVEARGEPVHDRSGRIVGATSVTINIDERTMLLAAEQSARERAEHASGVLQRLTDITVALAGTSTLDDVGRVMISRGVPAFRARSAYFATVDPVANELVMHAQTGFPAWVVRSYTRVGLDEAMPAPDAIRTGASIFIESPDDRAARYPSYPDDPLQAAMVAIPLAAVGTAGAVVVFGFAEPRRFTDDDRSYIGAVVQACGLALRRAAAFEAEQMSRARLRTLLESSERLSALDDPDDVLKTIARLAATRIGTWAGVVRIGADGRFEHTAFMHHDPARTPQVAQLMAQLTDDGGGVRRVLSSGAPVEYDNFEGSADEACLLVPITVAGRRLAVLAIGDERHEHFGPADMELAVDLGRRGASALERARLWQESQQRLEAEHRTVELLQRTIVPERLPDIPGVELGAAYRPAEVNVDVGGDWYDAFATPDGMMMIVVGDVAGHGIGAASLMGRARNALRAYAFEDSDPARILLRLHRLLRDQDETAMVTAFVGRHDPVEHVMSWSRAGHPPPLLIPPGGPARFLNEINGAPLGTMPRGYTTATTRLDPGALMVCYTDGLVERRDRVIDDGFAWLAERVQEHAGDVLPTLCDKLVDDPFVPHPSPDDVCVVALRVTAQ